MAGRVVTITDIAEAAGVSVPTVSRVLNGRPGVAARTRQLVEQAMSDAGYQRRRRSRHTSAKTVEFVINGFGSLWAMTLLRRAYEEAAELGLDLVVTDGFWFDLDKAWFERLDRRGSDGIVVVVSEISQFVIGEAARRGLPVVSVDPVGPGSPDLVTISATNWAGGLAATEHLLSLGHTRIGIITGPARELCSQDRLDGYSAALRRAGIDLDPQLVRQGDSLVSGGLEQGGALLDLDDPPTAIFSGADEQAYGIYQAARARGMSVPDDLSVVGFDDVSLCEWVSPRLTTVRQPLEQMAREAVRVIAGLTARQLQPAKRYELATTLVVRDSTASPRR